MAASAGRKIGPFQVELGVDDEDPGVGMIDQCRELSPLGVEQAQLGLERSDATVLTVGFGRWLAFDCRFALQSSPGFRSLSLTERADTPTDPGGAGSNIESAVAVGKPVGAGPGTQLSS